MESKTDKELWEKRLELWKRMDEIGQYTNPQEEALFNYRLEVAMRTIILPKGSHTTLDPDPALTKALQKNFGYPS